MRVLTLNHAIVRGSEVGNSKMKVSKKIEKGVGHFWEGDGHQKMLTSAEFQNGWTVMKIGTGTNLGVGNSKMEVLKKI